TKRIILILTASTALVACAVVTWFQLGHWRNDRAVWSRALAVTENNPVAENNWGIVLSRRGRLTEAEEHYLRATRFDVKFAEPYNNLGVCRLRRGEVDPAVELFRKAISLNPRRAPFYNNL